MNRLPYTTRLWPVLITAIFLLQASGSAIAQDDSVFASWHTTATRRVVDALPSPDGDQVAYLVDVQRKPLEEDSGRPWRELHLSDMSGATRPFITGEVNVNRVQWTRRGSISFTAKREGDEHTHLYEIPTTGGEAREIVEHETSIGDYSWSPDGQTVAFLATQKEDEEKKELEEKGFNAEIYEEDDPYTRVWVTSPRSDDPARMLDLEGSARAIEFSPDGRRLLVTLTPTPLIDDSYTRIKINLVDLETGETELIDNPGKLGKAAWSKDGSTVAMISAADLNDPAAGRLLVARSGQLVDLMPDFEAHVTSFDWLDETTLVYTADVGAETEVGTVSTSGGDKTVLVQPGEKIFTGVHGTGPEGELVLVADSPQHPSEAFTLDLGEEASTRRLNRLTDVNPWLDDLRFARQEVIRYPARDGLEIEGVLIHPLDYEEGKRYPLLMVVHGGPESNYPNGWLTSYSLHGQVAAARGFVVFYPNYRGSTGRGVEFSKLSQAKASAEEFDDYVDGVDHLIEIGLVDRDKVGITGGSYGGYASAWAATYYSDRFAAAAPMVGISNNISKVGTTDIPQEMYDVHHRKWLWDDFEYFTKSSPIYWVERNQTATLIAHGKDDPRVHPSQSLELFRHLKVLDQAPVRLVLYPGEGHGNAKSAARFDYHLRVLRWMDHYLKGPGGEPPPYEIDYAEFLPWGKEKEEEESSPSETPSGSGR